MFAEIFISYNKYQRAILIYTDRTRISPNFLPDVTMSAVFYQAQWKPKGCYLEMF